MVLDSWCESIVAAAERFAPTWVPVVIPFDVSEQVDLDVQAM